MPHRLLRVARRLLAVLPVLTLVALATATVARTPILAQEATPEVAEGVAVEVLAAGEIPERAADLGLVRLERVAVAAGTAGEPVRTTGPQLLYVESGDLVLVDELGLEGAYGPESQVLLPAGVGYSVRNDGAADASLLRLSLLPAAEAAPAAGGGGTPVAGAAGSGVLLEAPLAPATPAAPAC